jgi:hypothetical protein
MKRALNPVKLTQSPITWRTDDLSIGRVENILGRDWVAGFFDDKDRERAIGHAISRARGAWDANEREHYAAYQSLARLLGRSYEERDVESVGHHGYPPPRAGETRMQYLRRIAERRRRYRRLSQHQGEQGPGYDARRKRRRRRR